MSADAQICARRSRVRIVLGAHKGHLTCEFALSAANGLLRASQAVGHGLGPMPDVPRPSDLVFPVLVPLLVWLQRGWTK
jgi:hypothetical protein